ncbi:MAG: NADH-quinone oxidoreductase subunit L [Bacteroidota bacterium]
MSEATIIALSGAILLLPLLGFLVLAWAGRWLPREGDWLATGLVTAAFVLSLPVLYAKLSLFPAETLSWRVPWVDFGDVPGIGPLRIVLGIALDNLAAVMLSVVTLISALVHFFSTAYMEGDLRYRRYFACLGLFSFSMLVIVLADNLLLLYAGWELVGLSSYLLIGHWYEKKTASDAAMKAFLVNRIGDVGFFTGIMALFATFHTFGLPEIMEGMKAGTLPLGSEGWLTASGVLIFCGAIGKSAQFPLHVWLPDAMEGPTPVSALIHAATMVAAGVYLVARTYPLLTADALLFIAYIGAATAFIAATIAVAQYDIKKVLAYSTISQLGYMVMGLGVGAYTAGFFHLVTHAMFKAGLFLASGSVIHAMHHALHHRHDTLTDPQDIRNMGGLAARMPVTYACFLVYTLAISGIPLTAGFLSKDSILAGTLAFARMTGHALLPVIGFGGAALTAFYMFRLLIRTFLGSHRDPGRAPMIRESPRAMTVPLVVLAALSLWIFYSVNPLDGSAGWLVQNIQRPDPAVPPGTAPVPAGAFAGELHGVHLPAVVLSLVAAGAGILLAFAAYRWGRVRPERIAGRWPRVHAFLLRKWYFDELYDRLVVGGTLLATRVLRWFDDRVVDGIVNASGGLTRVTATVSGRFDSVVIDGLVNMAAYASGVGGLVLRKLQTGRVQTYLVYVVLGVLLFYFAFRLI